MQLFMGNETKQEEMLEEIPQVTFDPDDFFPSVDPSGGIIASSKKRGSGGRRKGSKNKPKPEPEPPRGLYEKIWDDCEF